jgi:1-acyl-sn-glycerol-3-phosphate acyltransferase
VKPPERLYPFHFYWHTLRFFRAFFRVFFRFHAYGVEHVPPRGPCIVAANHASYLDPPAVACGIRTRVIRYFARDSLSRGWLLRQLFRALQVIPIARERGDVRALREGIEQLREGALIGLFPEGTRTPDGSLRPAKAGIGFLIAKSGAAVVPVHVDGTFRALPRGRVWPRLFTPITVRYGPPISAEEFARFEGKDAYDRIAALVMERIAALRSKPAGHRAGGVPAA